jgi:putative DNA-invertase from lambdoid prophage Rac
LDSPHPIDVETVFPVTLRELYYRVIWLDDDVMVWYKTITPMTRRKQTTSTASVRAFGYCRVSTNAQATEGHSLPDQKSRIAGYCQAHGLPAPTQFFVDPGISGTVSLQRREAGARMLSEIRKGDHIIVTRGDRLFRSAKNALEIAEMLRDEGVELHLMDMGGPVLHSSVSRLVFGILMMVANMESERIGERVASVKDHLRKQGRYLGGALAVGYSRDAENNLKMSRDWKKHLATMKALSEAGKSTRQIAEKMKERGLRISHNTVYRVLVQRRKTDVVGTSSAQTEDGA